jgi:hypothetical protein
MDILSQYIPGGTEENHNKSVRRASVSANIRTEHQFVFYLICYIQHYMFRPKWVIFRCYNFYIELSDCNVLHLYTYIF